MVRMAPEQPLEKSSRECNEHIDIAWKQFQLNLNER